jgi:FkbH-like protein
MAVSPTATVALAQSVAGLIKAAYGRSKKCLVLDLDNTLWGGVIGDDGVENLVLGRDHPLGEAYTDFQEYVKGLKERGVILAVCSKNDAATAIQGFSHPDTVLKLEDFSAFKANWNPKPQNIREIAAELNIGLDSLVFVDDNPAERALVERDLPEVAVPEVGSDVAAFAEVLEQERFFEVQRVVKDDLDRSSYYQENAQRNLSEAKYGDYGEFLASLEMSAEIGAFAPVYLDRITQLINKTNQFNLTTRRYTIAEVEDIGGNAGYVALYGRLADRFGDNGLVTAAIGRVADMALHVDLWVMSCRVFKREMELAMFDALVEECRERGIRKMVGVYIPSNKNGLVAGHYASLGFTRIAAEANGRETWAYELPEKYTPKARHIRRTAAAVGMTA